MKIPWIFYGTLGFAFVVRSVVSLATCPDSWIAFHESCYFFAQHESASFNEAEHFCQAHGAHLITIDDVHENNFVLSVVEDHIGVLWWIGLTDSITEGEWKWIPSDESPSFTFWDEGQPEDHSSRDQDCVALHNSFHYKWHDDVCTMKHPPICEKPSGSEVVTIG
ncbi:C-type lectin domain family 10 member A-like isoform X2 [Mya arenaria]|uniref:C-type lectin domain family 10 member A-like isoform X2 n=1 Tax=Mya arenaria TaxID=6604 RepID=UPI0022E98806|nr:C-type lectin domain family 10 member A-like isoform X2 [Mya arenaria]